MEQSGRNNLLLAQQERDDIETADFRVPDLGEGIGDDDPVDGQLQKTLPGPMREDSVCCRNVWSELIRQNDAGRTVMRHCSFVSRLHFSGIDGDVGKNLRCLFQFV